jgi:hypothetical protein
MRLRDPGKCRRIRSLVLSTVPRSREAQGWMKQTGT